MAFVGRGAPKRERRRFTRQSRVPDRGVRWIYGALALLLGAYVGSVLVRGPGGHSPVIDGWLVDAFETSVGLLSIARGLMRRTSRVGPIVLGLAILSWAAGDTALTVLSLGGSTPQSPSVADAFYLGFFPLAYVALVLMLRVEIRPLGKPNWLDGVLAGLGAAAMCAAFAFHGVVAASGGSRLSTAVNLAYPVADVLLLGLVVCGTALVSGWARTTWLLLAIGIAVNVAGDTFNLFGSTVGASFVGYTINAVAWPVSLLLMSLSVWIVHRGGPPRRTAKPPGFFLPGAATAAAITVLVAGSMTRPGPVAITLAATTLVLAGARLGTSTRTLRSLTMLRHQQSLTDHLTGLGNRRQLFDVLESAFDEGSADGPPPRVAFLFIDLDHFKEINDSFGHPAGDDVLRQVGARLSNSLRVSDILVRLGGDEFAALLFDATRDEAQDIAVRLAESMEEPFQVDAVTVRLGVSIGVAVAPYDARDATGLMWCADVAMYRAKLGGFSIARYDVKLDDTGDRMLLAEELRTAIESCGLILHYQPQLDLHRREVLAVEALVRWQHPQLGLIPPMNFIPLAEDAGLIGSLSKWVLATALTQCARWRDAGHYISVSVNIAPSVLLDSGFVELVASQLRSRDLSPELLVLEITETGVINAVDRVQAVIEELGELGVAVSIDDFGAGVTSLAYLGNLSANELKLDRSFIAGISNHRERELVRATIELGHRLGMRVVAEGIEDTETLSELAALGCDLAQGYVIAHPKPADKLRFRTGSDLQAAPSI